MTLSFQFCLSMEMVSSGERGEGRPVFLYFATELKNGDVGEPTGIEMQGSTPEELAKRMKAYMARCEKEEKTAMSSWNVQGLPPDNNTSRQNLDSNSREKIMSGITLAPPRP